MPKMDWGLSQGVVENFDRGKVFAPYKGQTPPTGAVYAWALKSLKLVSGTKDKLPQLRAGLEIYPRSAEERRYKGFYRSTFSPVADHTAFRYVPFLDALGITEREFRRGTIHDSEGNIKSIGRWKFEPGKTILLAQLIDEIDQNNKSRASIRDTWFEAYDPANDEYADDDDIDGADVDEDDDGEWE